MTALASGTRLLAPRVYPWLAPRQLRSLLFAPGSQQLLRSWRNKRNEQPMSTSSFDLDELVDSSAGKETKAALIENQRVIIRDLQQQLDQETATSDFFEQLVGRKEKHLAFNERVFQRNGEKMEWSENMVTYLGEQNVKIAAGFAEFSALYRPETNIMPVLERNIRDWYLWNGPDTAFLKAETALSAFVGVLSSNDPDDKMSKLRLVQAIDKAAQLGQIDHEDKYRIENELKTLFNKGHENVHETQQDLLEDLGSGFVVNGDETYVAAAVSTLLIYFGYPHTVMTKGFKEVRYAFDVSKL